MKTVFIAEGMQCKMCAGRVERAAVAAGASAAEVQLESKRVTVTHECAPQTIADAITAAGYPARIETVD